MSDSPEDKKTNVLDYFAAAIIGVATVLGALCAFFAALWGGVMNGEAQKAIFELSRSNTAYLEALSTRSSQSFSDFKDDYLYLEWTKAIERKAQEDADYLVTKMSPEQAKALESDDIKVAEKAYAEYDQRMAAKEKEIQDKITASIATFEKTQGMMKTSQEANAYGDRFTFNVVLFTLVLFFGGMAGLAKKFNLKAIYACASLLTFGYSLFTMFTIPFPAFG